MDDKYEQLARLAGAANVKTKESMRLHTTFRTGGPADYFVAPQTEKAIAAVISFCRETALPFCVIGNGSNLLVSDEGFRGVIVHLGKNFGKIAVDGTCVRAQAGALLSAVANTALAASLTGLEFASGIPGAVGGACVMNAGAYGGELKDVLKSVRLLTPSGQILDVPVDALALGYRTSRIPKQQEIVLGAAFSLAHGNADEIRAKMQELNERRREKQPLSYPSAGSTFKRPEGYFAGKLIEDAGLRGFRLGDAAVSEKHCGFVVNLGNASSGDIDRLIRHVQEEVKARFGVTLEPEVKLLGDFTEIRK